MPVPYNQSVVITLADTVATRSYPFTRETLDQIQDLRHLKEKELGEAGDVTYVVPAPVIIAEAIEKLHAEYFV